MHIKIKSKSILLNVHNSFIHFLKLANQNDKLWQFFTKNDLFSGLTRY